MPAIPAKPEKPENEDDKELFLPVEAKRDDEIYLLGDDMANTKERTKEIHVINIIESTFSEIMPNIS